MEERKTIYLCLAHMSEEGGMEHKYVKEAFDTNWVVSMGRYNLRVIRLASRVMSRCLN